MGRQCILLGIDVKRTEFGWEVFSHSGTIPTGKEVIEWALMGQQLGVGELLVTSIDRDGTQEGYDLELMEMLSTSLSIPVIASGGVGKWEDIRDVFVKGKADAALAASLFHFNGYSVEKLKRAFSSREHFGETMIYCSIDLMAGKAVQLVQGKAENKKLEVTDVMGLALKFSKIGPINVIDLDAALEQGDN